MRAQSPTRRGAPACPICILHPVMPPARGPALPQRSEQHAAAPHPHRPASFCCGLAPLSVHLHLSPHLQAQLRGLINDYQGGDEATFAQAFECFDMLSRCLEEMKNPGQAAPAGAPTADVPSLAPPPGAPTSAPQPSAQEAPLISLD